MKNEAAAAIVAASRFPQPPMPPAVGREKTDVMCHEHRTAMRITHSLIRAKWILGVGLALP